MVLAPKAQVKAIESDFRVSQRHFPEGAEPGESLGDMFTILLFIKPAAVAIGRGFPHRERFELKIGRICWLIAACALFAMSSALAHPPQFRVLMITTTDGWHHESIADAVPAIRGLAEKHHFDVVWEENIDLVFTEESLAEFDVIMFVLTTGDILDPDQQALMESFIRAGKGFVGVHSASDTEYDWPGFTQLVGRMFHIHPAIQTAELSVIDREFPGQERMPDRFWFTDEYYEFGEETVSGLNYLLTIDERTYDPVTDWGEKSGTGMGDFHPLAWYQEFDGGRSFYTALGHLPSVYEDELFLEHLYGGIYWAATGKGL